MIHNMVNHQKYEWILSWLFNKKNTQKIMNKFGLYYKEFKGLTNTIYEYATNNKNKIINNHDIFNNYYKEMKNKNGYSKHEIISDLSMVFFAAIDTTYSSLTFTLLMFAKYPLIQNEIYKELNNSFNNNINNISLNNNGLLKIPKLRAFFYESMRINTIAPMCGFRKINTDNLIIDTTKIGGNKIYNIPNCIRSFILLNNDVLYVSCKVDTNEYLFKITSQIISNITFSKLRLKHENNDEIGIIISINESCTLYRYSNGVTSGDYFNDNNHNVKLNGDDKSLIMQTPFYCQISGFDSIERGVL